MHGSNSGTGDSKPLCKQGIESVARRDPRVITPSVVPSRIQRVMDKWRQSFEEEQTSYSLGNLDKPVEWEDELLSHETLPFLLRLLSYANRCALKGILPSVSWFIARQLDRLALNDIREMTGQHDDLEEEEKSELLLLNVF